MLPQMEQFIKSIFNSLKTFFLYRSFTDALLLNLFHATSLSIPPERVSKQEVFCFQGVIRD